MNDELDGTPDQQIEAAVTQTYAAHAHKIGQPTGRLDDVLRRVGRRRNKRRTLAGVASLALVGAGIGGIVAAGQMGSEAPALGTGGPSTTVARDGWFVCSGAMERNGATVYDWCELETPYANPAWSCSGEVADPAVDGDDRPRFENCTPVGEAYSYPDVCVPITVIPVGTVPGVPQGTAPPTTWVEGLCTDGQPLPTYVAGTTPAHPTVPCSPPADAGSVVCEPVYVEVVTPGTAPPTVHTTPVSIGGWGPNTELTGTFVVADEGVEVIAQLFGVTVAELAAVNTWDNGIAVFEGARVEIPGSAVCVLSIASTDTPAGVAERYGLEESQLQRLNPDASFDGSTDPSGYAYWQPSNTILVPNRGAC